jgi:hypothetical protein
MAPRQPTKRTGPRKQKKNVPNGVAYIQSTFNNTIVTISDTNGEVISWASAGSSGFKGAKKGTPFAAQTAAENAARRASGSWPGNYIDSGRDSHSSQWLPSSKAQTGLTGDALKSFTVHACDLWT